MRPKRCRFYLDIFEGDDPLGRVLGGVLEVVEAAVVQDKPASLPVLPVAALQWINVYFHRHSLRLAHKKSVGGLNIHRYLIYIIISAGSRLAGL